jgi:hypothetical protein
MLLICACVMLMVAAPFSAPSLSAGTWKASLPILITAIFWPFVPVFSDWIEPIVAPVLSFTGSPAASAAAADPDAEALVSAPDPVALELELEGAEDDDDGGAAEVLGVVDWVRVSVEGMLDVPAVDDGLAASADPAANATPAAIKGVRKRMKVSLGSHRPQPVQNSRSLRSFRNKAHEQRLRGRSKADQMAPKVFSRALGWISFWLSTTVWPRNRSTIERM